MESAPDPEQDAGGGGHSAALALADAQESRSAEALCADILSLPAEEACEAVLAVGRGREARGATVLAMIASSEAPKPLIKLARRELHRLRAAGIRTAETRGSVASPAIAARAARPVAAIASLHDVRGSRLLWLLVERPMGGAFALSMIVNDTLGIREASLQETTRKRGLERAAEWSQRNKLMPVPMPPQYAEQLLGEALAVSREIGMRLPLDLQAYLRQNGEPPAGPSRALIYDALPGAEQLANQGLLAQTPSLLDHERLAGWSFDPASVRAYALELMQAEQSMIVLSPQAQAERRERIISRALREQLSGNAIRGWRRRLEEAAYVLLKQGCDREARLLVVAALNLDETTITIHPLLRAIMEKSIANAEQLESAGMPSGLIRGVAPGSAGSPG